MPQKDYLGGHFNITNNDKSALLYLVEKFKIKTLLDVGCGPMGVVQDALDIGLDAYGVDGDVDILYMENIPTNRLSIHDFTVSPWKSPKKFDGIWSVEVAEHINEEFVLNYLYTISDNLENNGVLLFTHAVPGQGGYHHVNCKPSEYWIQKFKDVDIHMMKIESKEIRELAKNTTISDRAMVFLKKI